MSRGSANSSVFATPALTARVLECLPLNQSLPSGAVSHTFFDAIPLISSAKITQKVLRNPHLFVRLQGLRRLDVRCRRGSDDCARFFAIACSSLRKWRDVQIFPNESDRVNGQLVGSLRSLARAVKAGLLPELEDFYFHGIDGKIQISPEPERQKLQDAALRVLSSLPNNAAVRIGLTWGLPVDSIRPFADATFDPSAARRIAAALGAVVDASRCAGAAHRWCARCFHHRALPRFCCRAADASGTVAARAPHVRTGPGGALKRGKYTAGLGGGAVGERARGSGRPRGRARCGEGRRGVGGGASRLRRAARRRRRCRRRRPAGASPRGG